MELLLVDKHILTLMVAVQLILASNVCALDDKPKKIDCQNELAFLDFSRKNIKRLGPNILYLSMPRGRGGIFEVNLANCKILTQDGYNVTVLVDENSEMHRALVDLKIKHYTCNALKKLNRYNEQTIEPQILSIDFERTLYNNIYFICKQQKIDIIHCNKPWEYEIAHSVAKGLGIRVIAHYHNQCTFDYSRLKGIDAFCAVSPYVTKEVLAENQKKQLNIGNVLSIHPAYNQEKFLNFTPTVSKKVFFAQRFNVKIDEATPVICMIANLYAQKKHALLLRAIDLLVHQYNQPVHVLLAGRGQNLEELKKMTHDLNIEEYIKFLGFVDETPELLYYSDIKVLPSCDAFGIVLMEAALMKKPIILSRAAHVAGYLIKDGESGLLCDEENPDDLALKIKYLIDNPQLRKFLGENAYETVKQNFSNELALALLEKLYDDLYAKQGSGLC